MGAPHQSWLIVNLLRLRQAQFDPIPEGESERLGGNADHPTRVKQIGYRLEPVGSRINGEFTLRFEGSVYRSFQTRFRIRDKETEYDLFLLPLISYEPSINSIHNESKFGRVARNFAIRRRNLDAQRRYHGHIYLRGQFVRLLARDVRAGFEIPNRNLERCHLACHGLSSL